MLLTTAVWVVYAFLGGSPVPGSMAGLIEGATVVLAGAVAGALVARISWRALLLRCARVIRHPLRAES